MVSIVSAWATIADTGKSNRKGNKALLYQVALAVHKDGLGQHDELGLHSVR